MRRLVPVLLLVLLGARVAAAERVFGPDPDWVRVVESRATVREMAGWRWTTAHLTLENTRAYETEFTVERRIPKAAVVTGLTLESRGERHLGRLFERRRAQKLYELVPVVEDRSKDPALLEHVMPGVLRLTVWPVPPGREVSVSYTYVETSGRAPEIGRKLREMTEAIRVASNRDPWTFHFAVDAHAYRPDREDVAAVVRDSVASGILCPFTSFLAAPAEPLEEARRLQRRVRNIAIPEVMLHALARLQAEDGSWDPGGTDRGGDPEITGLVLHAFLTEGETHRTGRHRRAVKAGLVFLKRAQADDGAFVPPDHPRFVVAQARAALGVVQAYERTGSPLFKASAQSACERLARCRNPDGGWGARPGQPSTVAATIWAALVLRVASSSGGISIPPHEVSRDVRSFLESALDARSAADTDREKSVWIDGAAADALIHSGADPRTDPRVVGAVEVCREAVPDPRGAVKPLEWFFSAPAVYLAGGPEGRSWLEAMRRAVEANLDFGLVEDGPPLEPRLGRVGATALLAANLGYHIRFHFRRIYVHAR